MALSAIVQVLQTGTHGWGRFGPVVGFLAFGVLYIWWLRRQYLPVMLRKYRLDLEGIHQNPGTFCDWSQVSVVTAGPGGVAGTRVLCLRTREGKEERLVFDPAVVSEERLLGYANAQLARSSISPLPPGETVAWE
ncbi:MAG TPA: hypothetical protein VG820_14060 [Fimbriimonadaceae bacterium]|nr:hypothetical protein [Fimbriimonadaceae bacterium]